MQFPELNPKGILPALSKKLLFAPTRPSEEHHDYAEDRWQIRNLTHDPKHVTALLEHRRHLDDWIVETADMDSNRRTSTHRESLLR